jgi:hypothetical protein
LRTYSLSSYFYFLVFSSLAIAMLTGCPAKVDPGQNAQNGLKKVSTMWGIPAVHAITAGFNGVPSESNFTGPANTTNPPPTK